MMKLSKLAIGLLAVCAFSGQAVAGNVSGPGSLGSLSSGTSVIANAVTAGSFTDNYTFSVPTSSSFGSAISQTTLSMYGMTFFNINGLTESLFNTTVSTSNPVASGTSIGPVSLIAGNSYDLKITGLATGNAGGSYGGVLAVSAAPIPEPTEGALLLSGLGLMGFIATRRSNKEA
jgi:hypothetical protein